MTTPAQAFATAALADAPRVAAPDGSEVRLLLRTHGAAMNHFHLAAGGISKAIAHRSVDELWYVLSGEGAMWRADAAGGQAIVPLAPGTCVSIPRGTRFQFRAAETADLAVVGVTLPPWPGDDEALAVAGPWLPSME